MGSKSKKAFAKHVPSAPGHSPLARVPSVEDKRPVWRFGLVDFEGPFGWLGCRPRLKLREAIEKLGQFESMQWSEIEGRRHHAISVASLSKDARARLEELDQDDVEELFSLALSNKERVFGIRDRWIFKILWWDPEHQVCPSTLKNT